VRLHEVLVRPVWTGEEARFQDSMRAHHYLGALPKIGNTLWYVACFEGSWVALLVLGSNLVLSYRKRYTDALWLDRYE